MSSSTPYQTSLSLLSACIPLNHQDAKPDKVDQSIGLCESLLNWRSTCRNLTTHKRIAIEALAINCFHQQAITPWEHLSISFSFPQLARKRKESISSLAESLPLSSVERLAAALVLARVGLLSSATRCLKLVLSEEAWSQKQLINVASSFLCNLNTKYLLIAGSDSASQYAIANAWLEDFTSELRKMTEGFEQTAPIHLINIDRADNYAKIDLEDSIRCIHHVACSGGTIISKCLAAMAEVCLLSEINPINRYGIDFTPSNPLLLYEKTQGRAPLDAVKQTFLNETGQVFKLASNAGQALVLRDHSHSDFFSGPSNVKAVAAGVVDALSESYNMIYILTVRHPLDSYLALVSCGWDDQFQPSTFEEYCARYTNFLDFYINVPIFKYEHFCVNPDAFMKMLCSALYIKYDGYYRQRFGSIELSGDSGRRSTTEIKLRERRDIPGSLIKEIEENKIYHELCKRLDYAPT